MRENVSRFFPGGTFSASEMAALLVREALLCGVSDVAVQQRGEWTVVHSPSDWLNKAPSSVFHEVCAFAEGGPNAMRVEVLATALSHGVVTSSGRGTEVVAGEVDLQFLGGLDLAGRTVAFRWNGG